MVFAADDLGAWLIGLLADVGRKKLTDLVFGTEQERALRSAATAAIQVTAEELRPEGGNRAEELALVVGQVFSEAVPEVPLSGQATLLEALQAGIAAQLAVLDDASLTGTGQSSADALEVPGAVVAAKLTRNLLQQIMVRGSRGGPLEPLANQLNHDKNYLQGLRVEGKVDQFDAKLVEILAGLDTAHAVAAAPIALAQLPAVTAGFTGRDDELAVLGGLLAPAGAAGAVVVSAVAGLAGVGKTALAIQAGHAAMQHGWFAGVLFVDLHGYDEAPVEPGQALDALLRALSVPADRIPPTMEERAGLYRSVLAQISEPVLVIADNASTEAQIWPLLPGAKPHKVLVTSRHTLAGLDARLMEVTMLNERAGVELLDRALRTARPKDDRITGHPKSAAQLAGLCGGLPLALRITAALLKVDPTLSVAELAGELAIESQRLEALKYDPAGLSVAAAFELSYRRLGQIPGRMFRLLPVNPGTDISTAAAAVLAEMPDTEARKVLAHLAQAHMIEVTPGGAGRWRMHDLLRLYAQRLASEYAEADRRQQARDRLLFYYLRMTVAADHHVRALAGQDVPADFPDRAHALGWLDIERPNLTAAAYMAAANGQDEVALRLPLALAEYLDWRYRYDEKLALMKLGLEAARRLNDRLNEGAALATLAKTLHDLGRFEEAIVDSRDAVAIFLEQGHRRGEADALTNLGNSLREARRFAEAITANETAARLYRDLGDRQSEGQVLNNLGLALREEGRLQEAASAHEDALAIHSETGDLYKQGQALTGLGMTFLQAGQPDDAILNSAFAVQAFRQAEGGRRGEGPALETRAIAFYQLGRLDQAIETYREAAATYRENGQKRIEGLLRLKLGDLLRDEERFDQAVTEYAEAANVFRDLGNQRSARLALSREGDVLTIFGNALMAVRRFGEAITAFQDAASVYQEVGDQDRERIALNEIEVARAAQRA